jgi:hypothetical protein
MKRIILVMASSLALAVPTFAADPEVKPAQGANATNAEYYTATEKTDFEADDLIGSRVYATEDAVDADAAVDKASKDWDDIGEVNNLIISRNGTVNAVVVGVGGFLGIGEKNVALKMDQLKFLKKSGDDADDYFIVVNSSKERLEKAPEYKSAD